MEEEVLLIVQKAGCNFTLAYSDVDVNALGLAMPCPCVAFESSVWELVVYFSIASLRRANMYQNLHETAGARYARATWQIELFQYEQASAASSCPAYLCSKEGLLQVTFCGH